MVRDLQRLKMGATVRPPPRGSKPCRSSASGAVGPRPGTRRPTSACISGIEAKAIPGFRAIEVLREDLGDGVEFCTIMTFDVLANVTGFRGADCARASVPDAARAVPKRREQASRHCDVRAASTHD